MHCLAELNDTGRLRLTATNRDDVRPKVCTVCPALDGIGNAKPYIVNYLSHVPREATSECLIAQGDVVQTKRASYLQTVRRCAFECKHDM